MQAEIQYQVNVTDESFSVTNPDGKSSSVALAKITSIIVETNDSGPWGMDVWFIVMGGKDGEFCTYPMRATNDSVALDYFSSLPGFKLKGMDSTANAQFVCWQKT